MSAFGSPNPERPPGGHRTIRATFIATVLIPVASMLVIWALLVGGVVSGALGGAGAPGQAHRDLAGILWVAGTGLVIILIMVALMGMFAWRIAADIGGREVTAEHLADEEMPRLVEKLRLGEPATGDEARTGDEAQPGTRAVTAEVAHAEAAIASLARSAAAAAAAEASLRNGIGQVFVSLARRNQSLLQRQLRLIDALEQKASDPATLADLFPLDHLTTRMRRHAEGLIILSGAAPGRSWSAPVPVMDVIRGAVAEIEDYQRVSVLTRAGDAVAGQAVADMIHLLAELIENATLSSPPGTQVEVRTERVANGFAIEVDDRGLGIEAGQLAAINAQLANPPDFDLANADQLGLFVVGKLAARHGVRVALRPSPFGGTTAVVLMPNSLVAPLNVTDPAPPPDLRQPPGRDRDLGLPAADAHALPGRRPATTGPATTGPATTGPSTTGPSTRAPAPPASGSHAAEATAAQGPPAGGPRPDAGTYRGLPRRVRQASLHPHLRRPPPGPDRAAPASPPAPAAGRSPEEARDLVSSLQRGWQRGRETEPAADGPVGGPAAAATDERDVRREADVPQAGES